MARSRRLTDLAGPVLAAAGAITFSPRTVVATSGGADSAVALWAMCEAGADVEAVHVDHGWPGSRALSRAAAAIAARVGVRLSVIRVAAGPTEDEARQARYAALLDADRMVVVAHTADDQAETVVANLVRGAGLDGLAGMPGSRPGLVRPFLHLRRDHLREVAMLLGLPWLDDPANLDRRHGRVRTRALLRRLERSAERPVVGAIARAAELASGEARVVEGLASPITVLTDGRIVAIPLPLLQGVERPVAARAIRRALRHLHGGMAPDLDSTAAALAVLDGDPGRMVDGAISIRRRQGRLEFLPAGALGQVTPAEARLEPGGTATFGRWSVSAAVMGTQPAVLTASRRVEVFDADEIRLPLSVGSLDDRHRLRLGSGGHKDAVTAAAEAGVTADDRPGHPLIRDADGTPIWIPDVRRAALGWATSTTRRYLVLTASQEDRWTPVVC